jgi:2'-hydroxyisoflavone reductase
MVAEGLSSIPESREKGSGVSTRRRFLARALATGAALAATRAHGQAGSLLAAKPLRLLILGGTGNIGPYHVRAAVARGHHVSVFSRGATSAELPADVERLIGDRNGNLKSIENRDWDAVIDLATYGPGWVRSLGEAVRDHTQHYTFISTISVYDDPASNRETNEDSRVLAYDGSVDPYTIVTDDQHYGALKILCEREAEQQFPGRTVVLRPGFIGGPDETHGVLSYWAARGERGGEILAGGDRSTPVQYIDVRDLAEWVVRLVEGNVTGVFNVVSRVHELEEVIESAASLATDSSRITWVPAEWLAARPSPETWGTLLFWQGNEGFLTRISNARAVANGLTFRPLGTTLTDTLTWYKRQPEAATSTLNAGFKRDPASGDFVQVRMPWPDFLMRESETLAAWHAEHSNVRSSEPHR